MAAAGFPSVFQGSASTSNVNIGAVQKQRSSAVAGFPSVFPGATGTDYQGMGAVMKPEVSAGAVVTDGERSLAGTKSWI